MPKRGVNINRGSFAKGKSDFSLGLVVFG